MVVKQMSVLAVGTRMESFVICPLCMLMHDNLSGFLGRACVGPPQRTTILNTIPQCLSACQLVR